MPKEGLRTCGLVAIPFSSRIQHFRSSVRLTPQSAIPLTSQTPTLLQLLPHLLH
jgi:hypothetical protein